MQPLAATRTLFCLSLAVLGAAAAQGQTVYRCGPAGNQYSAQPCVDGRPVDVSDRRSAEQIADARSGVAAQRRLALAMARERSATERASPPTQAGSIGRSPAAQRLDDDAVKSKPASRKTPAKGTRKAAGDDHFVAVVPGSRKPAGRKAQP